jgi:PPOX class probable F420-dependent enzyme
MTTHTHYEDTSSDSAFATLGDEEFLSLTTFRRSGERVSTPMWVARDGDALLMFTPTTSGKVKRLRNDPRVELRPCDRFGRVRDGVEAVAGVAEVLTDEASLERATGLLREKYGLAYPVIMFIERLIKFGPEERFTLRITRAEEK